MGLFKKIKAKLLDSWCGECTLEMERVYHQLFMLPQTVGHYTSHSDAKYYEKNLVKVNVKKDIPTGNYACGIDVYKCPSCGQKIVKLSIFLPVRDALKYEDFIVFSEGELDSFISRN